MTTYGYETIPQKKGDKPRYFEVRQAMTDLALTTHPETGEPVRRVILGGYGIVTSSTAGKKKGGQQPCCCGREDCCDRS